MIKVAPAPEKAAQVKLATANINLALAHHLTLGAVAPAPVQALIYTLAPAPATPVAPVPPAAANTPPAPAPLATNGRTALVQY